MKDAVLQLWRGRDRRLARCTGVLGALYAFAAVVGDEMRRHGSLDGLGAMDAGRLVLYALGFGAALYALFSCLSRLTTAKKNEKESLLSRLSGNVLLVFLLLLVCWGLVWLAFWPGSFPADALTQFESYYNEEPYAHHPLIHTALLGVCMTYGIDLHPEGYATWGLAIYCGIQLVLTALGVALACGWMRRRSAPVWARLAVTLLFALCPFYAPWAFYSQKDVLFGVLALLFCLQLIDLYRDGMRPLRLAGFVINAVLMMLFRNNGVYALVLALPFAVWWAKRGKRVRMLTLLAGSMALYFAVNEGAIALLEAEKGSRVEMLSIPLQQIVRTLKEDPSAIGADEEGVMEALYPCDDPTELYHEMIADPVKWPVDYEALDEQLPSLLSLWARLGVSHLQTYSEAFLAQNLPYILPGSEMLYHFDMTVHQSEWFPIEQHSYLPKLREIYESYDRDLRFMGIPGTKLLSDTAFWVWLCMAGLGYACWQQRCGLMTAFAFLLAVWFTCLLGPVAIMRYMLALHYAVPVLWAYLLKKDAGGVKE